MSQCTATTKKGKPCRGKPMKGRDVCKQHTGDDNIGQPTKLTDERRESIMAALRVGNYMETVARANGIHVATFYSWMERGEADRRDDKQTQYAEFHEAATRALAEAEVAAVTFVRRAMPEDWRAAAHLLERRYPDRFGRRDRHAIDVKTGGKASETALPDDPKVQEAADAFLAALEESGE